jgi:hypothetical protein
VQFKLPPPDAPPPMVYVGPAVGSGAPVVETLAVASVWTVQALRDMCQSYDSRGLTCLGVAAVSSSVNVAFTKADANRATAVLTGGQEAKATEDAMMMKGVGGENGRPATAAPAGPVAAKAGAAAPAAGGRSGDDGAAPEPWVSDRPALAACTEELFLADLAAFRARQAPGGKDGAAAAPLELPSLCGSRLDVLGLYREVCRRGGYAASAEINWKGQVLPRMRNFAPDGEPPPGVGNALKRHYQLLLLDYQRANSRDLPQQAQQQPAAQSPLGGPSLTMQQIVFLQQQHFQMQQQQQQQEKEKEPQEEQQQVQQQEKEKEPQEEQQQVQDGAGPMEMGE